MKILVFNAGSSSLKFGVFDMAIEDCRVMKGEFENFKDSGCTLHYRVGGEQSETRQRHEKPATIEEAIRHVPALLQEFGYEHFNAIGHRVAHGGGEFEEATLIDDDTVRYIESCTPLAPLHNPANLNAIAVSRALWPTLPQVAVFDTAFHHTIPARAYTYAVPKEWRDTGLRRYGFHGTSHKYIALRIAKELSCPVTDLQIISCHLGNGASVCAVNRGFSIDTSMGMTPLEGLVMGTRSGDVDPGMFAYLGRECGLEVQAIENRLYKDSGLKALAGTHDMREIEQKAADGDEDAQLAINVYAYRARKYIGAYAAAMGGLDVIAFTGGIGENSASMRRRICDKFEFLGLHLDDDNNQTVSLKGFEAPQVQTFDSRIKVIVTQTCEQYMIAQETRHLLSQRNIISAQKSWHIPVAVSARHMHLSQKDVEKLFGKGHQLTHLRDLIQTEGWATEERVEVVGPKGSLKNVRILGPARERTQIEVSKTDTFTLGIEAPIRPSGKLDNTPVVKLRGSTGEIETNGLIIAARHIHMSPEDAIRMGLKDGDYVDVRLGAGGRGTVFTNTLIRVKEGYVTEMHIDTDEANAAGIEVKTSGELVKNETRQDVDIIARKNMELDGKNNDTVT
ncbi:MAG: acetate/propionate family kinase [Alphaproteobacteria bacterium CG_4_9_14_3_um_filter_47_13]|nr:MAG: acetate/propionate family kinase [Alphaproteobacteria bacterium CG_4_9_14_3_um_filter_47_13]